VAEKVRKTQEEEIIEVLKREGFQEVPESELIKEPSKSHCIWPECVTQSTESDTCNK
jgi:hypothetical protein